MYLNTMPFVIIAQHRPGTPPPPRARYNPPPPLQCRACWQIRSLRGQYASYWNAILPIDNSGIKMNTSRYNYRNSYNGFVTYQNTTNIKQPCVCSKIPISLYRKIKLRVNKKIEIKNTLIFANHINSER